MTNARKTKTATDADGARLCPYRAGSKYAAIWQALWRSRKNGITRKALIEQVTASDERYADPKTCDYAVTVVTSPTRTGRGHKSATGGGRYWVEKTGGVYKLSLRRRRIG
jgi:hypothetical protein